MLGDSSQRLGSASSSSSALDRFDSRSDAARVSDPSRGGDQRLMLTGSGPSGSGALGGGLSGVGADSSMESLDGQLGVDGRRKRGPKKSGTNPTLTFKRGENGIEAAIRASLQGVKSGADKDDDDHHVTPVLVSSTDEFTLSQVLMIHAMCFFWLVRMV